MVMCFCYSCKNKFDAPDPYAKDLICPKCFKPIVLAEKICGECCSSAQIADGNLICCMVSTAERLMLIYYNVDASTDGGCPHFKRPEDLGATMIQDADKAIDGMFKEVEQIDAEAQNEAPAATAKPKKDEEKEFEDAFNQL